MKDAVLSVAVGFDWPDIEPYAVSLARSGFEGDKILFALNLTEAARTNLLALGFILEDFPKVQVVQSTPLNTARFLFYHQYLETHPYRFVVFADSRDLVFQKNPSHWLEGRLGYWKIVASPEFIQNQHQFINRQWVEKGYAEIAAWALPHPVYCGGYVSGVASYMKDLALAVYLTARGTPWSQETAWGADQTALGIVLHQKAYVDCTLVPKMADLHCLNIAVMCNMDERPFIYDWPPHKDGVPLIHDFVVLHQYDRIPELAKELRARFSFKP